MNVEIQINGEYKTPKAIILTDRVTEEITAAAARLSEDAPQVIAGFKDDVLRIIRQEELIRVYAGGGRVYAATGEGEFVLRQRLYEMEERLDGGQFVRISNSEIINLKMAKEFDLSLAGTICVHMTNGTTAYVSRRYVSKIKKILGI